MENVERLVDWIAEQVRGAGAHGAVFGLSGGLDSTVVGALCARALGEGALGVRMPCMSDSRDEEDARLAADTLGFASISVDLNPVFESFAGALPEGSEAAVSNLKPRLRMVTLYYLANDRGMLVAGTSNKSERSVGYFTKYGDSGADIYPLADIYKTDLYEIAAFLGVPERIMRKPPSAGLWGGQTDEGELGVSYGELDGVLKAIEEGRPLRQFERATVDRVRELVSSSAHKREPIPIFEYRRKGGMTPPDREEQ